MYYALTISADQIITGVHESGTPITTNMFSANAELSEDTVVSIPSPAEYQTYTHILCYEEDGIRKSDVWCIENGYMELPPYAEIIDGVLVYREMPPEERPITLEDYFGNLVNEAKAEAKALVDTVQEEAYQQVTASKEELSSSLAEANSATTQKFSSMRPLVNELIIDKPAEIVIPLLDFMVDWREGDWKRGKSCTYEDYPYKVIQGHNSTGNPTWHPGTSETEALFMPWHGVSRETALPWLAPKHAEDIYRTGEWMIWTDGSFFECLSDTEWPPDVAPAKWRNDDSDTEEPPIEEPPAEPEVLNSNGTVKWGVWVNPSDNNSKLYNKDDGVTVSDVRWISLYNNNGNQPADGWWVRA